MQQEKQNNISNKILQYTLKKGLWGSNYKLLTNHLTCLCSSFPTHIQTQRKTIANTCLRVMKINTYICIGIIMNVICDTDLYLFIYFVYICNKYDLK